MSVTLALLFAVAGLWFAYWTTRPFGGAYLYFPLTAVWASSLYGGLGPGVLTLALSLLGFDYFLLGQPGRFGIANVQEAHRLMEFGLAGLAGSWICAWYRSARLAAHRATDEAKRLGALQERLVAVVGHDLRNPLAAVRVGLEILEKLGPLGARQHAVVSRMQRSVRRMERLIEDLLGFARRRPGKSFPIALKPARLGQICANVVSEFEETLPDRAIQLSIENDRDELLDSARLEQVVSNLVSNAVRHGSSGEPVEISVRGLPDELVLGVTNRGAPIPPELLPHIFEPFRTGRSNGDGLGLGLFVVNEIVAAHGGSVSVRSDPRQTAFEIHLPSHPRREGKKDFTSSIPGSSAE